MFKLCVFFALVAVAVAAPAPEPAPAPAPAPAPGIYAAYAAPAVLASSGQYINRNYNTLAAAPALTYSAPLTYGAYAPYGGHIIY